MKHDTQDVIDALVSDLEPTTTPSFVRAWGLSFFSMAAVLVLLLAIAGTPAWTHVGPAVVSCLALAGAISLWCAFALSHPTTSSRYFLRFGAPIAALALGLMAMDPLASLRVASDVSLGSFASHLLLQGLAAAGTVLIAVFLLRRFVPDRRPAISGLLALAGISAAVLITCLTTATPDRAAALALVVTILLCLAAIPLLRRLIGWSFERYVLARTSLPIERPPLLSAIRLPVELVSDMPQPALVLLAFLVIVPFWSLSFLDWPWQVYQNEGLARFAVIVSAYWVLPLVMAASLLRRSFFIFPSFLAEIVLLAIHAFFMVEHSPAMQAVRFGLIIGMAGLGFLFGTRDFLFPFFSKGTRSWRRLARLTTNVPVSLVVDGAGLPLMMQDCSLRGMSVYGDKEKLQAALRKATPDAKLSFSVRAGGVEHVVQGRIAWKRDQSNIRTLGLVMGSEEAMARIMKPLAPHPGSSKLSFAFQKLWVQTSVRRMALAAWAFTMAGAFGAPACQERTQDARGSEVEPGPANEPVKSNDED